MLNSYLICIGLTLTLSCAASLGQVREAEGESFKPILLSGIELKNIDTRVRLQDDFYGYVNGAWLKNTEIPADRSSWTAFNELNDLTLHQLHKLIESKDKKSGMEEQKINNLYRSFMDEARIEKLGLKPIHSELATISTLKTKNQIPALIAHFNQIGVDVPYYSEVVQDAKNSSKYIVSLMQSGIGLPDRDYYLSDDIQLKTIREKYQIHIAKMLEMSGDSSSGVNAENIVMLETALAKVQWTKVDSRDPIKTYNHLKLDELDTLAPDCNWKAYLTTSGFKSDTSLLVSQPSYINGFNRLLQDVSLPVWRAYFRWHLLNSYAPYLPKNFVDQDFLFYGTVLRGIPQPQSRWKRAVGLENDIIGNMLGKYYTAEYFPSKNKIRMEQLVGNLLVAYRESINNLNWMSSDTKKEAQTKLAAFTKKIGYPDKWRDYATLKITNNDLIGNVKRANAFNYKYNISKLDKPIDRNEWDITPQTVDAYYKAELNEIVFPAAILQPPFFNAAADDAVNYGAIGMIIGHEISHGFDDQGAKFDEVGNLRNWWAAKDYIRFETRAKALVKQYSEYSPLSGYLVNGELTLGENIADNSGLAIAYKAYKLSLGDKVAPVIDGLSGEQRFFLGFAQMWRSKMRDEEVVRRIKIDSHSPSQFRVKGALQNLTDFYSAFGIKSGDAMYIPPEQRVVIW